jgi:phage gp36-like protein
MAQYVTVAELARLGVPGDAYSGLPNEQINSALAAASDIADSYLNKRYTLPLVSWRDDLRLRVAQIASKNLMASRGFRPGSGNDEVAVDAEKQAIAWLKDIARGDAELAGAVDSTPDVDEAGALTASDEPMSWRMTTGGGDCE